jgi:hypothetical protein
MSEPVFYRSEQFSTSNFGVICRVIEARLQGHFMCHVICAKPESRMSTWSDEVPVNEKESAKRQPPSRNKVSYLLWSGASGTTRITYDYLGTHNLRLNLLLDCSCCFTFRKSCLHLNITVVRLSSITCYRSTAPRGHRSTSRSATKVHVIPGQP